MIIALRQFNFRFDYEINTKIIYYQLLMPNNEIFRKSEKTFE